MGAYINPFDGGLLPTPPAGSGAAGPASSIPGGLVLSSANTVSVVSSTYTVQPTDYLLLVDTSATGANGPITINLPNPANRQQLMICDVGGAFGTNNVTLARFGTEKIAGLAASLIISANGGSYGLNADGTNWWKSANAKNLAYKLFTSSGTFTPQAGIYTVFPVGRGGSAGGSGGGGGGGGSSTQAGGGGSGGSSGTPALSYAAPPQAVVPGVGITITIGAGGTAGGGGAGGAANVAGSIGTIGTTGGLGGATSLGTLWSWLGSNNGGGGNPGNVNAGAALVNSFSQQLTIQGPASGLGGAPGVSGGASGTGPRGIYMGQGGPSGTGGTNGGAGQGGGGGAGASCSPGDFGGGFSLGGNGGNGGAAGVAGSVGTAASGTSTGGYPGAGGGGGGGGGVLTVTGTAGGNGGNGAAGAPGQLFLSWWE